jgi:hypothetical protein
MGAYEDEPGHVDVIGQEAPPPPQYPNGGTVVPGLDIEGTQAAEPAPQEGIEYVELDDDDDD